MAPPFSKDDFYKIIDAYKEIFPYQEPTLENYFNFRRDQPERNWSYICSNFYEIAKNPKEYYPIIENYDKALRELIGNLKKSNYDVDKTAGKIKELIAANQDYKHFGSAIGICPYTDELLLKSIVENENELPKEIVVVLAHDWYPIVSSNNEINFIPPLEGYSIFTTKKENGEEIDNVYGKMINLIPSRKYTILFLNLFPDYRKPGVEPSGRIEGVDYEMFAKGIINLIKSIGSEFTVKCIITWGVIPFDCLMKHYSPEKKCREMKGVIEEQKTLKISFDEREIPLIPSYHPSSGGRFYYNKNHQDYLEQMIKETLN